MTKAVQLSQVSFSYKTAQILERVSFEIEPGECVGIIGPNGGGKTTLLKLIMGFLKPEKGEIRIFGKSPDSMREKIAYVPQVLHFDRDFPVSTLEVVLMGKLNRLPWYGQYHMREKEAARAALAEVGLANKENAAFGTLSGGEAQRTLIARALVSEPELLLLDEPTASVDVQAREEIYGLIKTLPKSLTILMVTHDLRAAIEQFQRVLCVERSLLDLPAPQVCQHFAVGLYHPPLRP